MNKLFHLISFLIILNFTLNVKNSPAQWVQLLNGIEPNENISALTTVGNNIFAGTLNGVWYSTNDGANWTQTSFNYQNVYCFLKSGNNFFAGTDDGIYVSANQGMDWNQISFSSNNIHTLAAIGSIIFAGVDNNGVYRSTDNGTTWIQTIMNYPTTIRAFLTIGNNIFAGAYQWPDPGIIYYSTNYGTTWTQVLNLTSFNCAVISFTTHGNNIFAGTFDGAYLSTNNGINWTQTVLNDRFVYSLVTIQDNIIAGTSAFQDSGIYRSTNDGDSWIPINEGFNNAGGEVINAFLIKNNYIFAATNLSVWRRPLSEVIGIRSISTKIPSNYSLSQNYPNPFNPITKIKFDIVPLSRGVGEARGVWTELKIFDITGREIQTLVRESLNPGTYEMSWNASQFSSGIYFYRLTANNFSDTKKMLMIK